ncbi:MAG TPA: autotransporter-associated beta strand repeat-containing protein [Verrucomicrobiae bacterium]|nr:autotransporter-associated beta strand repeat-containing protein [Verrucomicrobiae bacterium]
MKTQLHSSKLIAKKVNHLAALIPAAVAVGLLALAGSTDAATITKSGTGTNLNDPASWSGATPTPGDVAAWDSTSLGAGLTLPAATNWNGISVSGALSDISVTGSGALTLGSGGIDMSTSPVNMTWANNFVLGASQTWTVNSGMTLSINGLSGANSLTKDGAGTLTTAGGTIGGDLTLTAGTFQMSQDFHCNDLYGNGTIQTVTGANKWLFINNSVDDTFSGTVQSGPGTTGRGLGFNKSGAGTLTLNGNAKFTDTLTVQSGTLNLTGAGVGITNPAAAATSTVGTVSGANGILNISNGASVVLNTSPGGTQPYRASLTLGTANSSRGFLQMSSGTLTAARQLALGNGPGSAAYGAIHQTGGSISIGGFLAMGLNGDRSVANISGGTFNMTGSGPATIGAGGNASGPLGIGVLNLSGSAIFTNTMTDGSGGIIWLGEGGTGILNMFDNASMTLPNSGLLLGKGNGSAQSPSGTANLLGGTVTATKVFKLATAGSGTLNFNGGTLKPVAASTSFITNLTAVYIYPGGAKIDDNGFNLTLSQPLLAPTGQGVVSIPVTAGGSGYIDTPVVLITNVDGAGATAIAQIDYAAGTVTNILITSAGHDYSTPPQIGLFGGGGSGATLGTPALGANSSGGLTKLGSGTLTLAPGNLFAGAMNVLGGTLGMDSGTFLASPDLVISNAIVLVNVTNGISTTNANLILQSNAVINIAYSPSMTGNPTFPAMTISGNVTTSGTNVINLSGGAIWAAGQFPLIAYTGSATVGGTFKVGTLPPGVTASIVNNTGGKSIDLNISFVGQNLTWLGTNNIWDVSGAYNWSNTVSSTFAQYLEYSGNTIGDLVTFDDTLFNDGINPQATNINLTTTVHPAQMTVNSSLPYTISGAGSLAGSGALSKSGIGSLTLGTANSYAGGTTINNGTLQLGSTTAIGTGSLTINGGALDSSVANLVNANNNAQDWNGDFSFAGTENLNMGSGDVTMSGSRLVTVNANTLTIGGNISALTFSLTKDGNGTLALNGSNTITGNITVPKGALALGGGGSIASAHDILVGNTPGQAAALYQSGTSVIGSTDNGGGAFQIGQTNGAAGYYKMSGGTANLAGEINIGGFSGASGTFGQLDFTGGTIFLPDRGTDPGSYFLVNRSFAGGESAVVNILGGTVQLANNATPANNGLNGLAVNWASPASLPDTAAITIGSGGQILTPSIMVKLNMGTNYNGGNVGPSGGNPANACVLNLNSGGLLQTLGFLNGATNNPNVFLNFNGGTLKAGSADNASYLAGLGGAYIYSGGVTLDDNGKTVTIGQGLQSPAGNGVGSIAVGSGGSGYTVPPQVIISGDGVGASAYATIDPASGAVTGIVVTSPGSDYSSAPSVSLNGITSGAAATIGTVNMTANSGGALTKIGLGTLTLGGADTYDGATAVDAGELLVTPAHQVTGGVNVADGAAFGVLLATNGTASIGSLTLGSGSSVLDFGFGTNANPTAPFLISGSFTNNSSCTVRIAGGNLSVGVVPLLTYSGTVQGSGSFNTAIVAPHGVTATVSNDASSSTLYAVITQVGGGIVWTGTNSVSPNLWDINSTTNWVTGGLPVTYAETIPPGDSVTFNDIGSGTVLLSNTVSPASVLFSNSTVNYTVSGTGHLSGTTGLTKQGTGSATISIAGNDYAGNTVISNGTLRLGSTTTIPDGAGKGDVLIGSTGKLDMGGFSEAINGLIGSGTVDNASSSAVTLTLGSSSDGNDNTWSGMTTNSGTGGISITKTGTNTLIVTGTNYLASGAASQINNGTLIITNGGKIACTTSEFWVGQNGGSTGTVVVADGTLSANSWLVIGRGNAAANGTLIVNGGTVQKSGGNNIVVGSLSATGKLIVNDGQVLNNGNLWIGENAGAYAEVYLNGGLIQATQVRPNGTLPAGSYLYFNGGTLQATASSSTFITNVTVFVENGGIIDANGFNISSVVPLWEPPTGSTASLVKKGSGTLYLDGDNAQAVWPFASSTIVSNGTLAGIGTLTGPVIITTNGTIGAGEASGIGTLNINSDLTIDGSAAFRISKNSGTPVSDLINLTGNVNYGGTLVISNVTTDATPLQIGDTFTLFTAGGQSGDFTNIVGNAGSGLAYSFANGVLSIVQGIASNPTNITFSVSGNTLNLSWPEDHLGWILQSQTNALDTGLGTNWFDVPGSETMTSTNFVVDPASPSVFFRLRYPTN